MIGVLLRFENDIFLELWIFFSSPYVDIIIIVDVAFVVPRETTVVFFPRKATEVRDDASLSSSFFFLRERVFFFHSRFGARL